MLKVSDLATLGLCRTASRMGSVLMSSAQQGKQANRRMRIPLCSITPTRFRLLLPTVWRTQFNSDEIISTNDTHITEHSLSDLRDECITSRCQSRADGDASDINNLQKGCIYKCNESFNDCHNEVIL